ncbi:unnamed protein product [Lymnaea stagnalis]|uniref:Uncharacterized protein n=1 Tax=Lymnaea stagnalis TaxID=6523 RepID=A0AAV2I3F3_LYMST
MKSHKEIMDRGAVCFRWHHVLKCTVVVLTVLAFVLTLDFSLRSSSYLDSWKVKRANISSVETKNTWYKLRSGNLLMNSLPESEKDQPPHADIKTDITPSPTRFYNITLKQPSRDPGDKKSPLLAESIGKETLGVRMDSSSFSVRRFQSPTASKPDRLDDDHTTDVRLMNSEERNERLRTKETTYSDNHVEPNWREDNVVKRIQLFKMRAEEESLNLRGSSLDKTRMNEERGVLSNADQPNSDTSVSFQNSQTNSEATVSLENSQPSSGILSSMKHRPNFDGIDIKLSLRGNLIVISSTSVDVTSSKMIDSQKSNFDSTQQGQLFDSTQQGQLFDSAQDRQLFNSAQQSKLFDSAQDRQLIESRILTHEQSVDKRRSNVDSILRMILLRPARTLFTKPPNNPVSRDAAAEHEMSREGSDRNVRSDEQEVLERTVSQYTPSGDPWQFSHTLTSELSGTYDTVTHNTKLLLSYGTGDDDDKPAAYDSDGNVVECIPTPFVDCGEYAVTTDDADDGVAKPADIGSHGFTTSGQREQTVKENVRLFYEDGDNKLEANEGRERKVGAGKSPAGKVIVSEILRARQDNGQTNVFIVIINNFLDGKKKSKNRRDGTYEL